MFLRVTSCFLTTTLASPRLPVLVLKYVIITASLSERLLAEYFNALLRRPNSLLGSNDDMTLSKAVFSPRLSLLSHKNVTVSNAVLASPFICSHYDHTISNAVHASPSMRSHDDLTVSNVVIASPFMRSHDDLTVSNAVLASHFMRSHDDLTVSNAVLVSPFMRSHDDLTVSKAAH
ncbi:hypothetical protein DPMN_002409 [Dreissena polymorpha]|uniref:Uncharacterized protein n=1 Tax=Dreissena polymorpha TaxID=45954 RepID=A0A9D4ML88_DREPO|nr:hypothetical protein DPMN_002409 [Dreissena polymorpha]